MKKNVLWNNEVSIKIRENWKTDYTLLALIPFIYGNCISDTISHLHYKNLKTVDQNNFFHWTMLKTTNFVFFFIEQKFYSVCHNNLRYKIHEKKNAILNVTVGLFINPRFADGIIH